MVKSTVCHKIGHEYSSGAGLGITFIFLFCGTFCEPHLHFLSTTSTPALNLKAIVNNKPSVEDEFL